MDSLKDPAGFGQECIKIDANSATANAVLTSVWGAGYARTMATHDSPPKPVIADTQGIWQRRTWIWTIAAGLDVYVLGFVIGLQPAGPLCGSPLLPDSRAAEQFDLQHPGAGAAAACYRDIASDSIPVWILIALGAVLVLAGVTVRLVSIRRFRG